MMCMSRAAAPRVLGSVGGGRPSSNRLRTLMSVARRQSSRRGLMTKMSSASNLMSRSSPSAVAAQQSRPIITTTTKRPVLQHQQQQHQQQQPWGAAAALANNYSTVLSQSKTVAISTAGISNHNNNNNNNNNNNTSNSSSNASTAFMAVTASVLGAGTFTLVTENESGPEENDPEENDPEENDPEENDPEQEEENTPPPAQRSSDVPTTKSKPATPLPLASPASLRKFKRQSRKKKKRKETAGGPCILATSSAAPSTTEGGPFVLATSAAGSYHSNDVVAAPSSSSSSSSSRPLSARMRSTPLTSHVTTVSLSTQSHKKKRKKEHTAHPQQTPSFVSNKRSKHNHHHNQAHHPSATATAKDEHEPFNVKQVYDIQQVLGQGAYGRVYQAVRHTDGLPVALKALPRDTVDRHEFQREVTAMQRLEQLRQKQQQQLQQQHSCANGDVITTGQQHVVQMHDVHADEQNYYLALELIQPAGGCELLEHLIHHGPFSEAQAASFLRQLAEGLCFVHAANLTHADLKPENVLLSIPSPLAADVNHNTGKCGTRRGSKLVLVDFGCSVLQENGSDKNIMDIDLKTKDILDSLQITENQKEQRYGDGNDWEQSLGTSAYWSPELAADQGLHPTTASDMWAAGCIVYILLTGTHPFDKYGNATDEEILRLLGLVQRTTVSIGADGGSKQDYNKETLPSNLLMDELVFDERVQNLSESCVHLIKSLMHPDPTQRMTSDDFRRHAWVQGLTASWNTLQDSHTKLEAFWQRRFRAEILLKFSCMFADKNDNAAKGSAAGHHRHQELSDENLQKVFHSLDLDGNGLLDLEEIMVTFRDLGFQDTKDIRQLFESADLDGSGEIDWDEFRMIMHKQFHQGPGLLREKYRQARFRSDVLKKFQGTGTYNNKSAKSSLSDNGTRLREMFDAMDLDSNGILDAHEIRVVLRSIGEDNEEIISRIVAAVDLNHDGGVSWDEFQEIMNATTN